ncbi:hypothetical protein [Cytobacillus firmus]|uniref:hypothetical protein n=1 Tax=Cytobacillus firmus TaxID=1399 RepID=UPI00202F5384|nr:hypothetical protein [Cytobacillus firmus]URT70606.1 hypothetical protein NAF01_22960 [Cytobacillus firmus]
MKAILLNLFIIFGSITLIEALKHTLRLKNTKTVNFLSYLLMGVLSFVAGKVLLPDSSTFSSTLAIAFFIVALISLFLKDSSSEKHDFQ